MSLSLVVIDRLHKIDSSSLRDLGRDPALRGRGAYWDRL